MIHTLRGRLLLGMLAVFVAAMLLSSMLDGQSSAGPVLLPEPYQDALVLAVMAVPALALIWLVSSWSLRPLEKAAREARAIGTASAAARITTAGLPAELTPLVDAVNGALDRLSQAAAAERRFTENAAHALRTPLAVLSLRLARARAAPAELNLADIEQDLAHVTRLVAGLLALARAEHAQNAETPPAAPVNLARLAREAAAAVLPMLEAQGRAITLDLPETLTARVDPALLREALQILLENAVQHGKGEVQLTGREAGPARILSVADAGPGIAAGQEAAVFERFHKSASSTGSGLGLAILRELARSMGAEVAASGACFTLRLPG